MSLINQAANNGDWALAFYTAMVNEFSLEDIEPVMREYRRQHKEHKQLFDLQDKINKNEFTIESVGWKTFLNLANAHYDAENLR